MAQKCGGEWWIEEQKYWGGEASDTPPQTTGGLVRLFAPVLHGLLFLLFPTSYILSLKRFKDILIVPMSFSFKGINPFAVRKNPLVLDESRTQS